jgi:hypothetical protein
MRGERVPPTLVLVPIVHVFFQCHDFGIADAADGIELGKESLGRRAGGATF